MNDKMTINGIKLTSKEQDIFENALWHYQLVWIGHADKKDIKNADKILIEVGNFIRKFNKNVD
jgi:hypothetical protein